LNDHSLLSTVCVFIAEVYPGGSVEGSPSAESVGYESQGNGQH